MVGIQEPLVAVVGAAVTFVVERTLGYLSRWWRVRRLLGGDWLVWWETKATRPDRSRALTQRATLGFSWLRQHVTIHHSTSTDPELDWTSRGMLTDTKKKIVGQYHSVHGDDGAFMLTVVEDHRYMYGYWTGASFDTPDALGRLAYGRSAEDLAVAKQKVRSLEGPAGGR